MDGLIFLSSSEWVQYTLFSGGSLQFYSSHNSPLHPTPPDATHRLGSAAAEAFTHLWLFGRVMLTLQEEPVYGKER